MQGMQVRTALRRFARVSAPTVTSLFRIRRLAVITAVALGLAPALAMAASINYGFSSGTLTLRAVLDDGQNTSVLADRTSVQFDPAAGAFGTLTGLS